MLQQKEETSFPFSCYLDNPGTKVPKLMPSSALVSMVGGMEKEKVSGDEPLEIAKMCQLFSLASQMLLQFAIKLQVGEAAVVAKQGQHALKCLGAVGTEAGAEFDAVILTPVDDLKMQIQALQVDNAVMESRSKVAIYTLGSKGVDSEDNCSFLIFIIFQFLIHSCCSFLFVVEHGCNKYCMACFAYNTLQLVIQCNMQVHFLLVDTKSLVVLLLLD